YGRGSPFIDIRLPCGGGLDILLLPRPDRTVLRELAERRRRRIPCTLRIARADGALSLHDDGETGDDGAIFQVRFLPEIRFLVFGKGPEAGTFAALVQSAGYPNILLSPDAETLDHGAAMGCTIRHLTRQAFPEDLAVDARTAVVLFFHDHDWEPPVLAGVLDSPAFYIGAQGSRMARDARNLELEALGIDHAALGRLRGPIGLLPSARDARTLAISVLAEVLSVAGGTGKGG
ncbi:MAG: XdhC family protein, partial [Reyranella sp.]|nr:XdhC family protein [Reyranella sp.]